MPLPFILAGAALIAAGYGAKKGYDGYQDKTEANEIIEAAKREYDEEKRHFDVVNDQTNQSLTQLGELQLRIGKDFLEFRIIAEELLQKLKQSSSKSVSIDFPQHKLDKIDGLALSATSYMGKMAGAGAAGAAAAYAVYGGVMVLAAASTGTPIAALSGVAAYNATMAAIGGGAISAGGLGMAGGVMVLGGVVAAPILAIAGWVFASHAEEALSDARKARREVNDAVGKMIIGRDRLIKTKDYVERIQAQTKRLYDDFLQKYLMPLKEVALFKENGGDIDSIADNVINLIGNGFSLAAILADIITTPLFKPKTDSDGKVVLSEDNAVEIEIDSDGMQVINERGIEEALSPKSK